MGRGRRERDRDRDKLRRSRSSSSSGDRSRRRRSASRKKSRKDKSRRSDEDSPSRYRASRRRSESRERRGKKYPDRSSSESRDSSDSRSRSDRKGKGRGSRSSRRKSSKRPKSSRRRSSSGSGDEAVRPAVPDRRAIDDTESKIEKAIKAAEAAGLTMCKLPSYERKEVTVKEDMPTIQDRNVLDELNADAFVPKQFTSSKNKKLPDNIVIDLDAQTVKVPDVDLPKVDSPFHPDLFPDEKIRMEKWVKTMFQFRQKALRGEI